jgi:hypothetical protein
MLNYILEVLLGNDMKSYYQFYRSLCDLSLYNALYSPIHCSLKTLTAWFRFLADSTASLFSGAYEDVMLGLDAEVKVDRELTSACCSVQLLAPLRAKNFITFTFICTIGCHYS